MHYTKFIEVFFMAGKAERNGDADFYREDVKIAKDTKDNVMDPVDKSIRRKRNKIGDIQPIRLGLGFSIFPLRVLCALAVHIFGKRLGVTNSRRSKKAGDRKDRR